MHPLILYFILLLLCNGTAHRILCNVLNANYIILYLEPTTRNIRVHLGGCMNIVAIARFACRVILVGQASAYRLLKVARHTWQSDYQFRKKKTKKKTHKRNRPTFTLLTAARYTTVQNSTVTEAQV